MNLERLALVRLLEFLVGEGIIRLRLHDHLLELIGIGALPLVVTEDLLWFCEGLVSVITHLNLILGLYHFLVLLDSVLFKAVGGELIMAYDELLLFVS